VTLDVVGLSTVVRLSPGARKFVAAGLAWAPEPWRRRLRRSAILPEDETSPSEDGGAAALGDRSELSPWERGFVAVDLQVDGQRSSRKIETSSSEGAGAVVSPSKT
jgi:hypothetical protein